MTEDFKEKSKTTLNIPQAYVPLLEDIRLLKSDQNNPNRMSLKQHEEVWKAYKNTVGPTQ